MKKMISLVVVLLLAVGFMVACGGEKPSDENGGVVDYGTVFGPELDPEIEYNLATVEKIFVEPELFDTHVYMDVELVEVCPAGCWFYIADPDDTNNVTMYVTRLKESFTIPMEIEGSIVRIWGKVTANNRGEILEGHRIELLD